MKSLFRCQKTVIFTSVSKNWEPSAQLDRERETVINVSMDRSFRSISQSEICIFVHSDVLAVLLCRGFPIFRNRGKNNWFLASKWGFHPVWLCESSKKYIQNDRKVERSVHLRGVFKKTGFYKGMSMNFVREFPTFWYYIYNVCSSIGLTIETPVVLW